MADKEITIKVSANADTQEVDDLKKTLEAMENTNIKVELDDSNVEEANENVEKLQEAFEEATNRVEELEEALAEVELNGDDIEADRIADELAEAQAEAEGLAEALASITGETLEEASNNAQDLADSTEQTTNSVEELNNSMGLIEGVMIMDLANQVGALGDQAEGMAQEIDNASISVGQLATNTGIAEPEMRNLIAYISNVTFPQNEAMAYVEALHQLGVESSNFGESATNMDRINDAFHLGYNNVISLTRGLANVGVDANNLSTSFNALAYAQSNVNGGVETLNLGLRRQGATFNELGLNIDQVAVIMSGASKKWTDARKLNAGLSQALKDCNGDLRALEKELGLQAGALDNASQYTDQYSGKLQQLADEEMEHKTGMERINAFLDDMKLKYSGVLEPLSSFGGLMGGFGQTMLYANATKELALSFGILKTTEEGSIAINYMFGTSGWFAIGWIALAVLLGIALGLALVYLYENCDWFRQGVDNLVASLQWLAGVITGSVVGTIQWLGQCFQDFTNSLGLNTADWKQAVLGFILFMPQLPLRVGQLLLDTIAKALGFGDNFTSTMLNSAVRAVNGFIDGIKGLYNGLKAEFDRMVDMVMNHPLVQTIIWLGQQISNVFSHDGLNQRSPGDVYKALKRELDWSEEAVENSNLPSLMGNLGNDVVGSFSNLNGSSVNLNPDNLGNNNLSVISSTGGQVNYFTFNDTVVDNDDRMRKICDWITKEINWNNTTAGRSSEL